MSDKETLKAIKSDSGSIWKRLFSSPADSMRAQLGPILRDVRDITFDDVFSEACIVLMQNVKEGKLDGGELNLEGYLYVLCKRIALKYAGRRQNLRLDDGTVQLKDSGQDAMPGTPDDEMDDAEEVDAFLDRVLSAMPAEQARILRYYYWDKMSMKEIASLCGFKNENVAKSTKNRYMNKFKELAKQMLEDDEAAEAALARTMERAALRDQLDECRHMEAGVLAVSACKEGKTKFTDDEIIEGIRNNSPAAWKALYASVYKSIEEKIEPILK